MGISREEAKMLAEKGTIFGYPLVLMDITRKVATAASRPTPEKAKAPANQLLHLVFLPDHTFRDVVRPNVDTLYSVAWLDLRHEPMVLSLPEAGDPNPGRLDQCVRLPRLSSDWPWPRQLRYRGPRLGGRSA